MRSSKWRLAVKNRKSVAVAIAVVLLGVAVFVVTSQLAERHSDLSAKYPYLADRLFDAQRDDLIINFTQLREVMKEYHANAGIESGVYFEYLPTGTSIGVNDQLVVEIASLTKVPSVMAAFKSIDSGELKLDDRIVVQDTDLDKGFGELWKKGKGTTLTVRQAIELSLKQSDNTAVNTLVSALDDDALDKVYDELDLPKTRIGPFPTMSPKSYASVFRNLYLSAYLEPESSNLILDSLTHTDFNDKLPAGVPSGTVVSHKIGVFELGTEKVFNDCGIIYIPYRPYILCVVVKAKEEVARKEIINYSKMVYSYVAQVNPAKPRHNDE